DDQALVALARGGDLDAYGELVRRHQDAARRVAAAVGGLEVAEDAAQEGFLRAFAALGRFDEQRPVRPWLLAVVANTARNVRRSGTRWEGARRRASERELVVATGSVEDDALARTANRALTDALNALPRRQREVVACRFLMGLSEEETAACLGVPRGTVKSRLSRALDRLEALLRREVA